MFFSLDKAHKPNGEANAPAASRVTIPGPDTSGATSGASSVISVISEWDILYKIIFNNKN